MINNTTIAREKVQDFLNDENFMRDFQQYYKQVQRKVATIQANIPTAFDNALFRFVEKLIRNSHLSMPNDQELTEEDANFYLLGLQRIEMLIAISKQGRFINYIDRLALLNNREYIWQTDFMVSQGVLDCLKWKNLPLFKTVYDLSIYQMMLWELKPRTILEIGSGFGASAIWLADLVKSFNLDTHIYSIDINKPNIDYDGVTFIEGDSCDLQNIFPESFLENREHPWLIIEDAHSHVAEVLSYLHPALHSKDYLVVEDSATKARIIKSFTEKYKGFYKVDTYYTDFFGINATCSVNSILVKMK